jgi:hypothetical protein
VPGWIAFGDLGIEKKNKTARPFKRRTIPVIRKTKIKARRGGAISRTDSFKP